MNYDMRQSGERIRQLRIINSLTQQEIAERLNVDRSFYSRIEAGKSGCSVDLCVQLSDLFRVSLDYLILGKYSDTVINNAERALLKEDAEELMTRLERIRAHL